MRKNKQIAIVLAVSLVLTGGMDTGIGGQNLWTAQASAAQETVVEETGLDVEYHTQQEIADYMSASGVDPSAATEYETEPVYSEAPYSAGSLTQDSLDNAVGLLNQIRYIAGLGSNVTLDSTYTQKAQAGCLVNAVNNTMSHTPSQPEDMDTELYELGYAGCSRSNLGWGYSSLPQAILSGWMGDSDAYNISQLGHRRWLLNPTMGKTGFGKVGSFTSGYVVDLSAESSVEQGIAWPAREMPLGYFQAEDAWSYGYRVTEDLNIEDVTVELTCTTEGKEETWNFQNGDDDFYVTGYSVGMYSTVIFRPDAISSYDDGDTFQVIIRNNGSILAAYQVCFFDASAYVSSEIESVSCDCESVYIQYTGAPSKEAIAQILPDQLKAETTLGMETTLDVQSWTVDTENKQFCPVVELPDNLSDPSKVIDNFGIAYTTQYMVDRVGSIAKEVEQGDEVSLDLETVMGGPDGFYHYWYRIGSDGVEYVDETDNCALVLTDVQPDEAGVYFAVSFGYWGDSFEQASYVSSRYIISGQKTVSVSPTETVEPTRTPIPTVEPTEAPSPTETPIPTIEPTETPSPTDTVESTRTPIPTVEPTKTPSPTDTVEPTRTPIPTVEPTETPSSTETVEPTSKPTDTPIPTIDPTGSPESTTTPTADPTGTPEPTTNPTAEPTQTPASEATPNAEDNIDDTDETEDEDEDENDSLDEDDIKVVRVSKLRAKAGKKKIVVSWKDQDDADGYQLCYSTKNNRKKAVSKKALWAKYTITKLKPKKKYFIWVRAYYVVTNENGQEKTIFSKYKRIQVKTK